MPSTDTRHDRLGEKDRQTLLKLAYDSIEHGLRHSRPLPLQLSDYSPSLLQHRAAFVTLQIQGRLRGCIGHLEAIQPAVKDVVDNAFAAAFHDPRFPPLTPAELAGLEIHISLLTPAEPMKVTSEAQLLAQLRPGVDGLTLRQGMHQGTFLPSVWEQLPTPEQFLRHLKLKAGLPLESWSDQTRVERYQAESIP